MRILIALPLAIAIGCLPLVPATAGVMYRTVALSGAQAPGMAPGEVFRYFDAAVLNNGGETAFQATVINVIDGTFPPRDREGVWSEGAGTLSVVAYEGGPAPSPSSGNSFRRSDIFVPVTPTLNDLGYVAFKGALRPSVGDTSATNDEGIWSEESGTLSLVVREGDPAPGTSPGATFSFLFPPVLSKGSGDMAFHARLQTGADLNAGSGIWARRHGALTLVMREGNQAPGSPAGTNFGLAVSHVINAVGQTAFFARLQSPSGGVTSADDSGIWSEGSGTLALVAREGFQAPDAPLGAVFSTFGAPVLNNAGQTAFKGSLKVSGDVTSADDEGIWSEGSGSLALVAREGSQAPGVPAGANFRLFTEPAINNAGRTAFLASLQWKGGVTRSSDTGIWSEGSAGLSLVAREGDFAPGAPKGYVFSTIYEPAINDSGSVAFLATLHEPRGSRNTLTGIWAENARGVLTLVALMGQTLEVAPGDVRTIQRIRSSPVFLGAGRLGVSFNNNFTIAFDAGFKDGTSGIFTATLRIPEPSSLAILATAVLIALPLIRRRQHRAPTTAAPYAPTANL